MWCLRELMPHEREALCKSLKLLGTSGLGQKCEYAWERLLPTGLGAWSPCSYLLPLPSSCCTASFGVPRRDYKCFPSQQHALTECNTVQSNARTTAVQRKEQRPPAYSSSSVFIVSSVSMFCSREVAQLTSADDSAPACSEHPRRVVCMRGMFFMCFWGLGQVHSDMPNNRGQWYRSKIPCFSSLIGSLL